MLVREMEEVLVERWVELRFYHIKKGKGRKRKVLTRTKSIMMIKNLESYLG